MAWLAAVAVRDGDGRDTERLATGEGAGLVIQNDGARATASGEVAGIAAAMRAGDDDGARQVGSSSMILCRLHNCNLI